MAHYLLECHKLNISEVIKNSSPERGMALYAKKHKLALHQYPDGSYELNDHPAKIKKVPKPMTKEDKEKEAMYKWQRRMDEMERIYKDDAALAEGVRRGELKIEDAIEFAHHQGASNPYAS